jgi:alpha-tubulin suppressor-like RCC1 family protein
VVLYRPARLAAPFSRRRRPFGPPGETSGSRRHGAQYPLNNPAPVPGAVGVPFRFTVNGFDHACGIDLGDHAWCWGDELLGELGNDAQTREVAVLPRAVQGGLLFRQIDAARSHTCGVTLDGLVYCWGSNVQGQLGTAAAIPDCGTDARYPMPCSPTPVPIACDLRFVRVAVGLSHSCAISATGEVWCRGSATALGAGDPNRVPGVESCTAGSARLCVRTPVRAETSLRFRDIDGLHGATCALSVTGLAYCWPLWGLAPGGITTTVPTRVPEPT